MFFMSRVVVTLEVAYVGNKCGGANHGNPLVFQPDRIRRRVPELPSVGRDDAGILGEEGGRFCIALMLIINGLNLTFVRSISPDFAARVAFNGGF